MIRWDRAGEHLGLRERFLTGARACGAAQGSGSLGHSSRCKASRRSRVGRERWQRHRRTTTSAAVYCSTRRVLSAILAMLRSYSMAVTIARPGSGNTIILRARLGRWRQARPGIAPADLPEHELCGPRCMRAAGPAENDRCRAAVANQPRCISSSTAVSTAAVPAGRSGESERVTEPLDGRRRLRRQPHRIVIAANERHPHHGLRAGDGDAADRGASLARRRMLSGAGCGPGQSWRICSGPAERMRFGWRSRQSPRHRRAR